MSIDDYADVPENNETALLQAVSVQPVSVAIDASGRGFQLYREVSVLPPKTLISLPLNPASFYCCNKIWISWIDSLTNLHLLKFGANQCEPFEVISFAAKHKNMIQSLKW